MEQGHDRGQGVPRHGPGLRGGDEAAPRPRRREPLGRRERPVVPGPGRRRRSSPTRSAADRFFFTGNPIQGVNPPAAEPQALAAAARRAVRDAGSRPTCARSRTSRPAVAIPLPAPSARPAAARPLAGRRRLRCASRDRGSRASTLEGLRRCRRQAPGADEGETRDPQARRATSRRSSRWRPSRPASAATCSPTSACGSRGRTRRSGSRPSSPPRRPSRRARARPCACRACGSATSRRST